MAHIPDGVLSGPVLVAGGILAAVGVARGLKELEPERIPKVAMLSAVMFVASLIHLPAGPASVHLLLNGMAGIMLGWAAFPALLAALLLQAVLFGFGGLLVLGVNTVNMAAPAVLAGLIFRRLAKDASTRRIAMIAALCSGGAVLLTGVMVAGSLAASGREFEAAARLVVLSHLPVMGIEAVFASAAIGLLARVKPEALA
ncbi:Substrate-specific component NikM of nickel ECF transporter [Paramagnetospirillum magnetotacticum MS-1]|uniref:Substrate-specific component NikM of nickel ECF transporter n=1 Tax=Paramagnetospirillum magnetotacticum MS-1 TaxID=272627 RepID=A0A0C2YSA6_PARME|nr:cobalt transporter CbiM [Paramagnetospirillum magnetotacticum]KIL98018.1 Substrate-specific component NikM of nickel ECF transporter [Paramagnetospirillum magnetotacticum MS-1]